MDDSEWFVLLLSPEAATSEWVNNEIEYWTQHKGTDRILPVVTEGHFDWQGSEIFPPALRFADEPRWVDLRFGHTDELLDLNHAEFRNAVADIASAVRGIPKDELASEEVRQHRRTIRTAWAAGIVVLLLGIAATIGAVVAVNQSTEAQTQRDEAQRLATIADEQSELAKTNEDEAIRQADEARRQTALALQQTRIAEEQTTVAEEAVTEAELATLISRSASESFEHPEIAILLALEAHRRDPKPETEQAVLNALGSTSIPNRISSLPPLNDATDPCGVASISTDGLTQFGILDGQLVMRDTQSGATAELAPAPLGCGRWIADEQLDRRVATAVDGMSMWMGPYDGPWVVKHAFDSPTHLVSRSFTPANRLLFLSFTGNEASVVLLDATTGEQIVEHQSGDAIISYESNADGSLVALGWAVNDGADGDGITAVIDAKTGQELFRIISEFPAFRLVFDDSAGHLIAGLHSGTILTIDLATRGVISQVETNTTSVFTDLGIREDGLIVAVAIGQIELVDRYSGPIGFTTPLKGVDGEAVRPDGTVLLLTPEFGLEVIDLDGNALIERTWPIDPFALIGFGPGLAAATARVGGESIITDLTTGQQTSLELFTPEGDRYVPSVVWPRTDGLWTLSLQDTLIRWEGPTAVETIDLDFRPWFGHDLGDSMSMVGQANDGSTIAALVNLEAGQAGVVFTVAATNPKTAYPSLDGGLHVLDNVGNVTTFDSHGAQTSVIQSWRSKPEGAVVFDMTVDPASGDIAITSSAGIRIVDNETKQIEVLTDFGAVSNHAFARDGQLLVIVGDDGTVRLWNLVSGTSGGLVWDGTGASENSEEPWYDEATESIWVASSGRLLRIPLNPEHWIERACEVVGRNFTQEEWDRYVPGGGEVWSACSQFRTQTDSATEPAAAEPAEENVTVEGEIDFETASGSFTVTTGSEVLGCKAGTQEEMDGAAGVEKTLTCESGTRSGSFTITFVPPEGTWNVTGSTGDFEGLSGGGEWSGQVSADGSTGSDTWSGEISFTDG